ncbi:MAG: hypothetical protein M3Y72_04200 [Acidobacteriota bacterium]|nr:hypothetical protein [Acidobacteriota bacterium]
MPYSRVVILRNKVLAAYKWLLSFRKSDWEFSDYPVGIAVQEGNPAQTAPRFKLQPYRAYIINWTVIGLGDTPEEAKFNLAQNFENIKAQGLELTRPGRTRPIVLASQEKVSKDEALSEDFIQRVLGLDWAWISDESSLWDFQAEETNDLFYAKIREIYGVDVSDIESAKLWAIFERIENSEQSTWQRPST